jgi:hypothetical protein
MGGRDRRSPAASGPGTGTRAAVWALATRSLRAPAGTRAALWAFASGSLRAPVGTLGSGTGPLRSLSRARPTIRGTVGGG